MQCRIVDLRCKEVINICDGCRLGYPCDVEIDALTGAVVAIIVHGSPRFWGLFGKCAIHVVPWCEVVRIGDDLILIERGPPIGLKREFKRELKRELLRDIIK